MDFNEDLKKLTNNINNDLRLRNNYEMECQTEMEKAISKIRHEYYTKIGNVNNDIKKCQLQALDLYDDILNYSKFKIIEIGKILSSLLSSILNQKCTFDYIEKDQIDKDAYGVIILDNAYNCVIHKIDEDFIMLSMKNKNDYIKIYDGKYEDYKDSRLGFSLIRNEPHLNNKFPKNEIVTYFVNAFIDFVINYRILYKIDELNMRILHKLKKEFLFLMENEINEYHQEIKQNKTLKRINIK